MRRCLIVFCLALNAPFAMADHPLRLPGGVATPLPGTDITLLLTHVTDQRCPADVACVWQGMVRAKISVLSGMADRGTILLCNDCAEGASTARIGDITLHYVSLDPPRSVLAPLARNPRLSDYTLHITVTP